MNLVDLLAPKMPKPRPLLAKMAEVADNQQPRGSVSPPHLAESGGILLPALEIRQNPPSLAESETPASISFPPDPPDPPDPPNPPHRVPEFEKPIPITLDYFASMGVNLMVDDLAFLRWYLPKPTAVRKAAVCDYVKYWLAAMEAEVLPHRKENAGRRAANNWLRALSQSKAEVDAVHSGAQS